MAEPGAKEAPGGPCGSAQAPDRRGQPGGVGLCWQGTGTGGEGTASGWARGGLDWISGKASGPGTVVESPSLERFQRRVDVALGDLGQ